MECGRLEVLEDQCKRKCRRYMGIGSRRGGGEVCYGWGLLGKVYTFVRSKATKEV